MKTKDGFPIKVGSRIWFQSNSDPESWDVYTVENLNNGLYNPSQSQEFNHWTGVAYLGMRQYSRNPYDAYEICPDKNSIHYGLSADEYYKKLESVFK